MNTAAKYAAGRRCIVQSSIGSTKYDRNVIARTNETTAKSSHFELFLNTLSGVHGDESRRRRAPRSPSMNDSMRRMISSRKIVCGHR